MSSSTAVVEYIRQQVPDWDDELVATARFKAFSGQRPDWEPKFFFWKDLILKVARHLGILIIHPSQVKEWFNRGGLTPLCLDQVLLEMYSTGEILPKDNLVDPSVGRLSQLFKRVVSLLGVAAPTNVEDHFVLKALLVERATEVIRLLSESHWTSFCIITIEKLQNLCNGHDEASGILSFLVADGKARLLSVRKDDLIKGVKVSLVPAVVPPVSPSDCNLLHLIGTSEKLQHQLDVIDQRYEMSRKYALASMKSGNKQVALRHARQIKMTSESREKCASLLNRVEEVLNVIANAESTKKVAEAIQVGAQAIKDCGISIEEVQHCLEELDERILSQKEVEEALGSTKLPYTGVEDEDIEEELEKLEMEILEGEILEAKTSKIGEDGHNTVAKKEDKVATRVDDEDIVDSLRSNLSSLKLEAA